MEELARLQARMLGVVLKQEQFRVVAYDGVVVDQETRLPVGELVGMPVPIPVGEGASRLLALTKALHGVEIRAEVWTVKDVLGGQRSAFLLTGGGATTGEMFSCDAAALVVKATQMTGGQPG